MKIKCVILFILLLFLICNQKQITATNENEGGQCLNPTTTAITKPNDEQDNNKYCGTEKEISIEATADFDEDEDDLDIIYKNSINPDNIQIQKRALDRLISLVLMGEVSYEEIIKKGFIQVFNGYLENDEMKDEGQKGLSLLSVPKALPDLMKCLSIENLYLDVKTLVSNTLSEYYKKEKDKIFTYMDGILSSLGKVAEGKLFSDEMSEMVTALFLAITLDQNLLSDQQTFNFYVILSKLLKNENYKQNYIVIMQIFYKSSGDIPKFEIISKSQIFKTILPLIKEFSIEEREKVFESLSICVFWNYDGNKTKLFIDSGLLTNMKFFLQPSEVSEKVVLIIYQLMLSVEKEPSVLGEVMDETLPQVAKLMKHEKESLRNVAGKVMAFIAKSYNKNELFREKFPEDSMEPFCNLLVSIDNDDGTIYDILKGISTICEYHLTNYKELKIIDKKC